MLSAEYTTLKPLLLQMIGEVPVDVPRLVAFGTNPSLLRSALSPSDDSIVLYGNGANPSVIRSSGVTEPTAMFVTYEQHSDVVSAVTRLRTSFPSTPIYARSSNRLQAQELEDMGATEVVIESDELPRSAAALVWGKKLWALPGSLAAVLGTEEVRRASADASGLSLELVDVLLEKYSYMDVNASGTVDEEELVSMLRMSNSGVISDDEFEAMEGWVRATVASPLDPVGFCRLYARAPPLVKRALDDSRFL